MALLGIMTDRFHPRSVRLKHLVNIACSIGFHETIVFTPEGVHLNNKLVDGYVYKYNRWVKVQRPFPTISHDIGYYANRAMIARVKRIKKQKRFPFTAYGLGNKLTIDAMLRTETALQPHLLPIIPLEDVDKTLAFIRQSTHQTCMIKPVNGSKGRGIIRVSLTDEGILIKQNKKRPIKVSLISFKRYCKHWAAKEKYFVQPWIDINGPRGQPRDVRVLMQKNKRGNGSGSGKGVREGAAGSITSNVSRGGRLHTLERFLSQSFGSFDAAQLSEQIDHLAELIAHHLEKARNKRLVELGIDLAIDRNKHIWILEVNIKPGHRTIRDLYGRKKAHLCMKAPLEYARHLSVNRSRE